MGLMVVCVRGGLCSFSFCLLEIFFQFCSTFLVLIWLFCSFLCVVEPLVVLPSTSGFALVLVFHLCLGWSISSKDFWFSEKFQNQKRDILKEREPWHQSKKHEATEQF